MSSWKPNQLTTWAGLVVFALFQCPTCMFTRLYCHQVVIICEPCLTQECRKGTCMFAFLFFNISIFSFHSFSFSSFVYPCSHSQTVKVPVSWEAMIKLVDWFYSSELPRPPTGCLWENMDTQEKLHELQPYVELCWLAEFWFLEDVQEACSNMIVACLDSARQLCIKVIQLAANFSLRSLVDVAAILMAPSYRQLCDSGELEELDEELVDMVRAASVRFSQEVGSNVDTNFR